MWKQTITNPAITNRFWRFQRTIYLAITNILPYRSHSVKTTWRYKWLTSQTRLLIGQGRETLTFKALLYVKVAVQAQVCRLFCVVHIPLFTWFSLVQLGSACAITNTFVVNQIIRYNGVCAITKTPLWRTFFSVLWHFVIAGCHCIVFRNHIRDKTKF